MLPQVSTFPFPYGQTEHIASGRYTGKATLTISVLRETVLLLCSFNIVLLHKNIQLLGR